MAAERVEGLVHTDAVERVERSRGAALLAAVDEIELAYRLMRAVVPDMVLPAGEREQPSEVQLHAMRRLAAAEARLDELRREPLRP